MSVIKIDREEYRDKVLACWLGKNIGGTLGGPFECRKDNKEPMTLTFYEPVPKEPLPNDDLDLQLLWLDLLQKKGTNISSQDFAGYWLDNITYHCDEYGVAKANLKLGLKPPASGYYNNWFQDGMGAAIRSEIWAAIAPGKPEVAGYYAWQDACVDHYGDGIYGEVFLAALESIAFVSDDLNQAIDAGLAFLPESSLVRQVVDYTRKLYAQKVPLLESRKMIVERFGKSNMTDCVQNIGFIMLGLLYGEGDFEKSILFAVNCGYDTDCTAATVGAIMGILLGKKGIPERWRAPIGEKIKVDPRIIGINPPADLSALTEATLKISALFAQNKTPTLPKPFLLPSVEVSAKPFSLPFTINGNQKVIFPDFNLDLNPYVVKIPGTLKISTVLNNPRGRKVRILPACNDGVQLWLDGNLVVSHHEHTPIRPSPHYTESRFVDIDLSEGKHRIEIEVTCCRKPLEFSWVVSDWDDYRLFPLATDLSYT